jgi:hypothetical protein
MKRNSVGALNLRYKKTPRITTCDDDSDSDVDMGGVTTSLGECLFNNPDIMIEHILPYLEDEYDFYQFKQVNKVCNDVVNKYLSKIMTPENKRLSLLSNWFSKRHVCCICRKRCITNFGESLGLYCHINCVPPYNLYFNDGEFLSVVSNYEPGRNCVYLYDTGSPCVRDVTHTCRGYNLKRSYFYYNALDKDKVDEQLRAIESFIKFTRKSERIDVIINKKLTVRVGVLTINVYKYFCKVYPNHLNTMREDEIVEKTTLIHERLTNAHSEMNGFYRRVIKPKLYVSRAHSVKNWSTFLRKSVYKLRYYKITLIDFFVIYKIHESTLPFKRIISDNLNNINSNTMIFALTQTSMHYYNVLKAVISPLAINCLKIVDNKPFEIMAMNTIKKYKEVFNMYDTKAVFPKLYGVMRVQIDNWAREMIIIYDRYKMRGSTFIKQQVNKLISS